MESFRGAAAQRNEKMQRWVAKVESQVVLQEHFGLDAEQAAEKLGEPIGFEVPVRQYTDPLTADYHDAALRLLQKVHVQTELGLTVDKVKAIREPLKKRLAKVGIEQAIALCDREEAKDAEKGYDVAAKEMLRWDVENRRFLAGLLTEPPWKRLQQIELQFYLRNQFVERFSGVLGHEPKKEVSSTTVSENVRAMHIYGQVAADLQAGHEALAVAIGEQAAERLCGKLSLPIVGFDSESTKLARDIVMQDLAAVEKPPVNPRRQRR